MLQDHQQIIDDLWMAFTGEVDLDSKNYNATKLKQTPINGVPTMAVRWKDPVKLSLSSSHSDPQSPQNSRIVTCYLLPGCHLLFFTPALFSWRNGQFDATVCIDRWRSYNSQGKCGTGQNLKTGHIWFQNLYQVIKEVLKKSESIYYMCTFVLWWLMAGLIVHLIECREICLVFCVFLCRFVYEGVCLCGVWHPSMCLCQFLPLALSSLLHACLLVFETLFLAEPRQH